MYSLQRLLDCAALNSGRIRLIRSKLWAVTGSHLVMVACHTSPSVAIYAVNALYGLAQVWTGMNMCSGERRVVSRRYGPALVCVV